MPRTHADRKFAICHAQPVVPVAENLKPFFWSTPSKMYRRRCFSLPLKIYIERNLRSCTISWLLIKFVYLFWQLSKMQRFHRYDPFKPSFRLQKLSSGAISSLSSSQNLWAKNWGAQWIVWHFDICAVIKCERFIWINLRKLIITFNDYSFMNLFT